VTDAKPEQRNNDLPNEEFVSLRAAAAWLSGLGKGDLDDFEGASPQRRLGRTLSAARRSR